MNDRVEPALGQVDALELGPDPTPLLRQAEELINANADLASENLRLARQKQHAQDVRKAEEEMARALLAVKVAAEGLAKAAEARAKLAEGMLDYLQDKPEAGETNMKKAAQHWKDVKAQAAHIGFALSDLPAQTWDKLCARVNNSITQAVKKAGNNIQARKDSVSAWVDRVETSIDNTVARITAVPGQIRDYMVAKKVAAKEAATAVLVRVLRWGAQKEEAIRNTVNQGLSLGEAVVRTAGDVVKGVAEPFRQIKDTFTENTAQAQQRRRTP